MASSVAGAPPSILLQEEVRADPIDGSEFTLEELLRMHKFIGSNVSPQRVEDYWRRDCQPIQDEQRVDPADGLPYTLAKLSHKYQGQYSQSQCQSYFRTVMARRCPSPDGLEPSAPCRGSGGDGCRLTMPFASAAIWAADLPEVIASDGELGSTGNPVAVVSALRYAISNVCLAVGVQLPPGALRHWGTVQGLRRAMAALANFNQQPTAEAFTLCVASSKAVLRAFRQWLGERGPAEVSVTTGVGLRFMPAGRSSPVPRLAAEATAKLGTGATIPLLGFGTWQMTGEEAYQATRTAISVGYRHIDTAQLYQNEGQIGRAIRDSGVARGDLFLASKLSDLRSFRRPRPVVEAQMRDLGTDYMDLYMLHQPADRDTVHVAWREMEALHAEGKLRALGVSNFGLAELRDLLSFAKVPPVYLQNKLSVYALGEQRVRPGDSVMAFAREHGIQFFGYSVINPWPGVLKPLEDPHVLAVAKRCMRKPAQVLLRWALQLGVGVLPKSVSRQRIIDNFRLFDFELADSEMRLLTGLMTLSEGPPSSRVPSWVEDTYGLATFGY